MALEEAAAHPLRDFFRSRGTVNNAAIAADFEAATGITAAAAAAAAGAGGGSGSRRKPRVLIFVPQRDKMELADCSGFDATTDSHTLQFVDAECRPLDGRIQLEASCRWTPACGVARRSRAPGASMHSSCVYASSAAKFFTSIEWQRGEAPAAGRVTCCFSGEPLVIWFESSTRMNRWANLC